MEVIDVKFDERGRTQPTLFTSSSSQPIAAGRFGGKLKIGQTVMFGQQGVRIKGRIKTIYNHILTQYRGAEYVWGEVEYDPEELSKAMISEEFE